MKQRLRQTRQKPETAIDKQRHAYIRHRDKQTRRETNSDRKRQRGGERGWGGGEV